MSTVLRYFKQNLVRSDFQALAVEFVNDFIFKEKFRITNVKSEITSLYTYNSG